MTRTVFSQFANQLAQLYNKLLPIPCLLCGADAANTAICIECSKTLPYLDNVCERCSLPIEHGTVCGNCLHSPPEQDLSYCAFYYQNPINRLISDFKYHHQLSLTPLFADALCQKRTEKTLPSLLIPVPLHASRLKRRGYNQAHELTKALSTRLSIPFANVLIRNRPTQSQAKLSFKQRKKNVKNAFELKPHSSLPSHIAIIDDVLTSGHTANAITKIVKQSGVNTVEVWTIARTIRHD